MTGAGGDLLADVVDLLGELTRGRDDEHARTAAHGHRAAASALDTRQPAHGGQQEGSRLAGAGLRGGKDISAGQDLRNRHCLDGSGVLVAKVFHRGQDLIGKAKVSEAGELIGSVRGFGRERGVGSGVEHLELIVVLCSHAVVSILAGFAGRSVARLERSRRRANAAG